MTPTKCHGTRPKVDVNKLTQCLSLSPCFIQPPDNGPPPLPSCSLPEGYYEEAVPLSPGKAPEYITSNYDSDQMSSSYESYDEEEEDGKGNRGKKMRHQWPSEEASMGLVKDARICAFLLRKKRFGQWTKLLCVIKDNKLLCYKSSKDQTPQMELLLSGCSITHVPKDGKKKKHELKIAHQGADALVLAVQSKEQAEEWLKVMREVCSNGCDSDVAGSPVHKPDLEKKVLCDRPSSDGEPPNENGHTVTDCKDQGKGKKDSQKSQKGGTLSKGAGKKITKIIGLGKKKPSTDEQTSSAEEDIPTCGYLNVLSNNRWRERWCRLKDNQLLLHKDRTDLKTHTASLPLRGCEVSPGLDSKHPFAFRLLRNGQEVAVLEASSSEVMGRWLGMLLAETGSITDPAALHYDYIDVETTANVIQLAKQSFCFTSKRAVSPNPYLDNPANSYACPSGMALHYDDVPINGMLKGKKVPVTNGTASKQKVDKNQAKKTNGTTTNGTASVKRNNSSAEQYKYGKNRVEADAKMLQAKEEELINRKQDIRNRLTQLKKDRKDLRTAMEASTAKRCAGSLTERLKRVEDECKLKEDERVSLELEMTEVKESLKKALNGGVTLGLTIEPKSGTSSPQSPVLLRRTQRTLPISSCDTSDTESCSTLPVNSASLYAERPIRNPRPSRGHVLKKAK
ncbi:actin filament-associated protein 1-like, partial [Oncorhynchus masou masou]|uniref:actin filament-associated protein 1-like n=1 Tax=Oncorhynchus masou masou TaxID=90313 RepID=UPI003182C4B3